jgi:hypothetical protein
MRIYLAGLASRLIGRGPRLESIDDPTIIIRALLTSGGLRKFVSKHLYPVTGAAPPMLDYARDGCDILCGCPLLRRLLLRG